MNKRDLIHSSFPNETVSDFMMRLTNTSSFQAYSSLYNFHSQIYSKSKPLKDPSEKCKDLKKRFWKAGGIVTKRS